MLELLRKQKKYPSRLKKSVALYRTKPFKFFRHTRTGGARGGFALLFDTAFPRLLKIDRISVYKKTKNAKSQTTNIKHKHAN
jgi:hypothetical protein